MPPRKAAQASPAASRRSNVPPSPARSTRSTRSHWNDEDWENESVVSQQSSFKVPNSRSGKANSSLIGLKDTSVNVAAAFHAAQTGNFPTPTSDRPFASKSNKHPSKSPAPPPHPVSRGKSPAEQLADSARALSPVRFFLRSTDDGDEYPSFSSLGSGGKSAEMSYDYQQEEEFVRQAQAVAESNGNGVNGHGHSSGASDSKRKSKSKKEDLPYRPAEDDWQPGSDDSGGEGEGIVKGGALEARAESRGQRKEKGEGYLGMGLGIQPRQRRKTRANEEGYGEGEGDTNGYGEDYSYREHTPGPAVLDVQQQTPRRSIHGYRRSPTPAQIVARALSPRIERHSPAPHQSHGSRKRQPSSLRTIITNVLHGIALGLEFVVNLIAYVLKGGVIQPIHSLFGSGKDIIRKIKANWWKWFVGAIVVSLSLRLLDRPWRSNHSFSVPDLPPGSIEELIGRLTHLEQAVSLLSDSSNLLAEAEKEGKKTDDSIISRVSQLEGSLSQEKQRIAGLRESYHSSDRLPALVDSLKTELGDLSKQVRTSQRDWQNAKYKLEAIDGVEKDIRTLRARVDGVETNVRTVLEDGKLRAALERILPHSIPVRLNKDKGIDIDPVFWTEMRKVMVGKGEVESAVRSALASSSSTDATAKKGEERKSDRELEAWGEKLFERKISDGVVMTRADFAQVLEGEVLNLKHIIDTLPRHASPPPSSASVKGKNYPSTSVTIKTTKGDDVTSLLQDLIEAALLKYSKDTIARPDYALFTAGARVVPSITTDTLLMRSPGVLGRWVMGRKAVEGRSPATALHPDISVGNCWPFQGHQGQLGVLLNRRVIISDITVEHAASEVALDVSTAPKEVEVWVMVEGQENKEKISKYLETHPLSDSSIPPSPDHLLLGSYTYDPSGASHIQTFPVDPEIVELGVDVGIVIFKVKSNWGGDITCLYRVRVHGEAVEEW